MAITVYKKTSLIGGGAGSLDSIDGAGLIDGDFAFVTLANKVYQYILDDDSGAAEASPNIISPDANAGTKRWLLQWAIPTVTATAAELNVLDGMTASTAELNVLDTAVAGTSVASKALVLGAFKNTDTLSLPDSGLKIGADAGTAVTTTAAELNKLAGVTAGTATASKALVLGADKNVDTLSIGASGLKIGAGAGTAVTATAAELNYSVGVTSGIQAQITAVKPSLIALAYISSDIVMTASGSLKLDSTFHNDSTIYSAATGLFTCPIGYTKAKITLDLEYHTPDVGTPNTTWGVDLRINGASVKAFTTITFDNQTCDAAVTTQVWFTIAAGQAVDIYATETKTSGNDLDLHWTAVETGNYVGYHYVQVEFHP